MPLPVHLTPPTKENPSVTSLSPASYLLDPSLSSPLKRKTRLESTDKTRKSLKLDPSPRPEDGTILQYYERVKESLPEDRQEVVVCLPAMGSFGEIKTELRGLRDELQQMKDTHRREMRDVHATTSSILEAQIPLLVGNLTVNFARMLCFKHKITLSGNDGAENNAGHATSRLALATRCFTKENWSPKVGLPNKYYQTLQSLPKFVGERNELAHSTERHLARILLSSHFRESHVRHHWGGLYPFCYGKTIEEMAMDDKIVGQLMRCPPLCNFLLTMPPFLLPYPLTPPRLGVRI